MIPRRRIGFTLWEVSVVLLIVGGLLAGSGVLVTRSLQQRQQSETTAKLAAIQRALLDFRRAFDRLPCPADVTQSVEAADFGVEAHTELGIPDCLSGVPTANFSSGTTIEGMVPTKSLQLPDDYAFDAWGRRIMYAVDSRLAAKYADGDAFSHVPVTDSTPKIAVASVSSTMKTQDAAYVLVSFGANGHGAFPRIGGPTRINAGSTNLDELTNCHCENDGSSKEMEPRFVQGASRDNPSNWNDTFDDRVVFETVSGLAH